MSTHLCIHGDVFTQTPKIVDWIASRTGWPIMSDHDLIEAAGQRFGIPAKRLEGRDLGRILTDGFESILSRSDSGIPLFLKAGVIINDREVGP